MCVNRNLCTEVPVFRIGYGVSFWRSQSIRLAVALLYFAIGIIFDVQKSVNCYPGQARKIPSVPMLLSVIHH